MRNQIPAAERMGLRAITINSDNLGEWEEAEVAIRGNEVDIVLISPERLANERFRTEVLAHIGGQIALLVVDEAHCISDWGHDFRPHYRLLERIINTLPTNLRLLATTATANDRVMGDLKEVLGPDIEISKGDLNRPSLALMTKRLPDQAERLAWLAEAVPHIPGSGIIYTLTIRDALEVTEWLQSRGLIVESYTSQTGDLRPELEQALLDNQVKALVATAALGMGFDKPDLAFVIHYQTPGSVVAYYQQVGRAGRALDTAYGVLLSGREESDINDYFINSAFPTRQEVEMVLEELENAPDGLSIPALLARVNLSKGRIDKTIALLSLESSAPIVKQGTKWQLTAMRLSESFWERAERLTHLRRSEKQQMQKYVDLGTGHMEYLIRALDGVVDNVATPDVPALPAEPNEGLVRDAIAFLRRSGRDFEPRKRWPFDAMPAYALSGNIPLEHRAERGMTLSFLGDAGWGDLVRRGKYDEGIFSDDLVKACADMITSWAPDPNPSWVTCVPSLRHSDLVPDFARRLATTLGLPFNSVLNKIDDRPEQNRMANNSQHARNIDGSLAFDSNSIVSGPVLLIDDIVDSGWTMAVAAWLLRSHGSGEVFPVGLSRL